MNKKIIAGVFLLLFLFVVGIFSKKNFTTRTYSKVIVTTTGMLADGVQHIVGDCYQVEALMGPGVDPHAYKATPSDLKKMKQAKIIVFNGLHLEGKMAHIFERMKKKGKTIAASGGIEKACLIGDPHFESGVDPHIWFSLPLWKKVITHITEKIQAIDPKNKDLYEKNMLVYLRKLDALHKKVKLEISRIPPQQRILITAHDAFSYFGKTYQIPVRSLQGISTESDYGLKDVENLVNYIVIHKIKAIFTETSVSTKPIESIIEACHKKGHHLALGGMLYSDAMGPKNTLGGTYLGMVEENVKKMVSALS